MMGCMGLIVIASAIIGIAASGFGLGLMEIGFVTMGAGLALPYAAAPRLALSALSPEQAGQGSGIINACTFLAGSIGVAGGAIAWHFAGFPGVLVMIALAGACGVAPAAACWKGENVRWDCRTSANMRNCKPRTSDVWFPDEGETMYTLRRN